MVRRSLADLFPRRRDSAPSGPLPQAAAGSAKLARRADFMLGRARISPPTHAVSGPGGAAKLEPMVMRVLLALADAGGEVLTRDDLVRDCWDGRFVGEDAVNRVIGVVRRVARGPAAESFAIETIPKTGYRLIVNEGESGRPSSAIPRRLLIGGAVSALGGALGALTVGGFLSWPDDAERIDPRAADHVERAKQIMRNGVPGTAPKAAALIGKAAAISPNDAGIWGLLAIAWRDVSEFSPPDQTAAAVAACESAARHALAIDPRNGNALAALALLRPILGDWIAGEQRLRAVLAVAPDNVPALAGLGMLMGAVGRFRLALRISDRIVALEPLSPVYQYRRAYQLWTNGRLAEADQTIDRALQLWPQQPAVWYARMLIFELTGRPRAAMAMVKDQETHPPGFSDQLLQVWRLSLGALITRAPQTIAASTEANMAAAREDPGSAVNAINFFAVLGDLDSAFVVAEGYLLRRGPLIGQLSPGKGLALNDPADQRWYKTMMLFIPSNATLRADPRFLPLCRDIGLVDYWRRTGIRPDYLIRQA